MSDEPVGLIGRFIATHSIIDQEFGIRLRDLQAPGTDARQCVKKGFGEKLGLLDRHLDPQLAGRLRLLNDHRDSYAHGRHAQDLGGERRVRLRDGSRGSCSAMYLKVPERGLTLIARANAEALRWSDRVNRAELETSPFAGAFLDMFDGDE
ncbi:MAG: hypothetical protein ACLFQ5_08460 [Oceanicaulis sp.]